MTQKCGGYGEITGNSTKPRPPSAGRVSADGGRGLGDGDGMFHAVLPKHPTHGILGGGGTGRESFSYRFPLVATDVFRGGCGEGWGRRDVSHRLHTPEGKLLKPVCDIRPNFLKKRRQKLFQWKQIGLERRVLGRDPLRG